MNFPWQLHVGIISIPYHVIFETLAIFSGFRYFLHLRARHSDHIASSHRLWIIIGAIFGAVLGSRLVGGLEDPTRLAGTTNLFLHFYQNTTIVGGLLGGLFGVELVKKMIGERQSSGDLFTNPLLLGIIIGRIGCFSMGLHEETYGVDTRSFLGIDLGDGLMRHPVALYEIFFLVLLWIALDFTARRTELAEGGKFKLFMILYLSFRFVIEYIKPHYTYSIGFSTIQVVCLLGLAYYSYFVFNPKKIFTSYA